MHSLKRISARPALLIASIIVLLVVHGAVLYLFRQHLAVDNPRVRNRCIDRDETPGADDAVIRISPAPISEVMGHLIAR